MEVHSGISESPPRNYCPKTRFSQLGAPDRSKDLGCCDGTLPARGCRFGGIMILREITSMVGDTPGRVRWSWRLNDPAF